MRAAGQFRHTAMHKILRPHIWNHEDKKDTIGLYQNVFLSFIIFVSFEVK